LTLDDDMHTTEEFHWLIVKKFDGNGPTNERRTTS